MKEEKSLPCINEPRFPCTIPPMPSYTGVANLLKILTKTMELQGAYISTIAEVQYSVCKQAGIDIPEEFLTDTLGALTRSSYEKAKRGYFGEERKKAKDEIIKFLERNNGRAGTRDLENFFSSSGFSLNAMRKAKAELKEEGAIKYKNSGYGGDWSIVLVKEEKYETL